MDGGVNVLLHHFLRDHDGIFKIVPIPWHERDEHVPSQRELAMIGVWTVGDNLTALHMLPLAHDRFLIHARAGI